MHAEPEHWSNNPYWTEALDAYSALRERGQRSITIDLEKLEEFIFDGGSPAYQLLEAMVSVQDQEAWDGYRGAPRLVLALLKNLELRCTPPVPPRDAA